MDNLISTTRQFLQDNKIDYLLVNSTNEFLEEYTDLDENSRYFLTKFSGSTGDAVISESEIFLFVDGRYHEQADSEVDKESVKVVKMKLGESLSSKLAENILANKTLGVVSKKISQASFETLKNALKPKNIDIKLLDFDPIIKEKGKRTNENAVKVDIEIAGLSSEEKIAKISATLAKDDAILVTNLEEISYLFNLRDFSKNYSAKIQSGKCFITIANGELLENVTPEKIEKFSKVFVDRASINAYEYALLGKKAVPQKINWIKELKSIKTGAEISHYKECFKMTDSALYETRKFIEESENISEFDITQKLEENFYKFGAKSLSFKSIVAKDKNSALAHYSKNSKTEILKDGALVLIDCGAYYEGGYATDITRVFVKGTPSALHKEVYTVVLKGVLKAFNKKITSKTTGFDVDKVARKVLNELKPVGFEFSHSLGHGIGISVHESPPSLSPSVFSKTQLKHNMCFTIEPGLYNPKLFGVRLENSCYLVDEAGQNVIKSFSNMCFEKKLINFEMLTSAEKKQLKMFSVE